MSITIQGDSDSLQDDSTIIESLNITDNESLSTQDVLEEGIIISLDDIDLDALTQLFKK